MESSGLDGTSGGENYLRVRLKWVNRADEDEGGGEVKMRESRQKKKNNQMWRSTR